MILNVLFHPSECTNKTNVNIRFTTNCAAANPIAPADGMSHSASNISSMIGADRTMVIAKQIRCAERIESPEMKHFLSIDARKGSPLGYFVA